MTPQEAYRAFNLVIDSAHDGYKQYWLDRFVKEKILFAPDAHGYFLVAEFNGYPLRMSVNPRFHNGVTIVATIAPVAHLAQTSSKYITIRSESGFQKFVRNIHLKRLEHL